MDKVVLVSGGTSGIGRAIVIDLLRNGFCVATFARDIDLLNKLKQKLQSSFSDKNFLVLQGDVTKEESVTRVVADAISRYGRIDILVNNAGMGYYTDIEGMYLKKFQEMIQVNIVGLASLTKLVASHMKKGGGGLIVNMASIAGKKSFPWASCYSATKFAVMGFSDGIRQELKPHNIKVVTISPGMVDTDFWDKKELERRNKIANGKTPPMLSPESVARVLTFIASQPEDSDIQDLTIMPFAEGGKDIY